MRRQLIRFLLLSFGGLFVWTGFVRAALLTPSSDTLLLQDWSFALKDKAEQLGAAAASAGDVNGDGYDDVLVGAPYYESVAYKGGVVLAFYGTPSGLNQNNANWSVGGEQKGARFGIAIDSTRDVNGDGYDDVLVGSPEYNGLHPRMGRVDLFYGAASGLSSMPDWMLIGEQKEAKFGFSVSTAGDVNGDTYDDILIGAPWYDGDKSNGGAVFIFYGAAGGPVSDTVTVVLGQQTGAGFGYAVDAAGDVNMDGFSDVIVGAPFFDGEFEREGAAFIFYGSAAGLSGIADWTAVGGQAALDFGMAVAGAGDVNGDGYPDIVVGAPGYDDGGASAGAALLFYGSAGGVHTTPDHTLRVGQAPARLGTSVSGAGDVNGDGYDDIIAGAPMYSSRSQNKEGAAFVWLGSRLGAVGSWTWMGLGSKAGTGYGTAVSDAGDVNGDGYADLVVGAPLFKFNNEPCGQVFGYHGQGYRVDWAVIYLPLVGVRMP